MSKISNAAKGFVKGALLVPAMGLAAHALWYAGDVDLGNDYSLQHRFECAYSFNTPDSHKTFTAAPIINGYRQESQEEKYWAHPYVMWPATLIMGAFGAAVALDDKKRKLMHTYGSNGR